MYWTDFLDGVLGVFGLGTGCVALFYALTDVYSALIATCVLAGISVLIFVLETIAERMGI